MSHIEIPTGGTEPPIQSDAAAVTGSNQGRGPGVLGVAAQGNGVIGIGEQNGVAGQCGNPDHSGVWGNHTGRGFGVTGDSHAEGGAGVLGRGFNGALAGRFDGDVQVSGDIRLLNPSADCAEDFDVLEKELIEPGTVMVLCDGGAVQRSYQAYDKRVAGVISGAGGYKPGIVLDKQSSQANRMPIALLGKVYCKVDAQYAPIEVGDLLTTSPTPGHAMKADDPAKAFGSVIGKSMRSLKQGQELIPVLIALQ